MGLHVLRHLTSVKNVKLKTLYMPGSAAQVCLNVLRCIICINESYISIAPACSNEALDTALKSFPFSEAIKKSSPYHFVNIKSNLRSLIYK